MCGEDVVISIGLCREHYQLMYATVRSAPCDSCLARPKKGESFFRHCHHPSLKMNI